MSSGFRSSGLTAWLVRVWFALVALAGVAVAVVALVPNEFQEHVGVWPYGVCFVLMVAILGLPLLLIATRLDRSRAKR